MASYCAWLWGRVEEREVTVMALNPQTPLGMVKIVKATDGRIVTTSSNNRRIVMKIKCLEL